MKAHETEIRVRYQETDNMGVVYYANYLVWFEVARTEYLRAFGIAYKDLETKGMYLIVAGVSCSYRSPARYDDCVRIKTWVSVEPVIEPKAALRAMELCHEHVDRFAVGKLNHSKSDVDWTAFLRDTLDQFAAWDCGYYIKDALWDFTDDVTLEKER